MDVVVAVMRPKQSHASQGYRPQLYEILLLDSKTPPGEMVKLAKYLPMFPIKEFEDEEPRELVLTYLLSQTGVKGERAIQIHWRKDKGSRRESLAQFSLYFVPVRPFTKVKKKHKEQVQNSPAFYPLDYVLDVVGNNTISFPSPTQKLLQIMESWLKEKHRRPIGIECLFGPRAVCKSSVLNPGFIPNHLHVETVAGMSLKPELRQEEIVRTANKVLNEMLGIEKCDAVELNPLFGSGLPYKSKPNFYVINDRWPSIPRYDKINFNVPSSSTIPWVDQYPLHNSAAKGEDGEVKMLLQQGHDYSLLDTIGWAPIHYAAWYGCISVVEILIDAGCSPNLLDGTRSTALHMAAKKGNEQLARCLLQCHDVNLGIKDETGRRAIDVCTSASARTSSHLLVEKLIRLAAQIPNVSREINLMDKTRKHVQLTPMTTAQQLNDHLLKMCNLPRQYSEIFTLWVVSRSLELQLKPEQEVERVLQHWQDRNLPMLTDAKNPLEEKPVLVWRRNVKFSVNKEKQIQHPKVVDLLFHEAHHNYIHGLYPCKDKDTTVSLATILFALQHHEAVKVKSMLSNLIQNQLKDLVPPAEVRQKDLGFWVKNITKEYSNYRTAPQQELKFQFLNKCQRLTVYGSAFFTGTIVSASRKGPAHNAHCHIGVNYFGLHLINVETKQMVQSLEYREIRTEHIPEKTVLEIKIIKPGSRGSEKASSTRAVMEIQSRQAGFIKHLLEYWRVQETQALRT